MNRISIGIFDEHQLTQEGIRHILSGRQDMEVIHTSAAKLQLIGNLKTNPPNILLINLHAGSTAVFDMIVQINADFPGTKTLIISVHNDEETILKTIKAGAKGFLARDTKKDELIQAIYTLRSGHDYFSESVTRVLLQRYITEIKHDKPESVSGIETLSSREHEIIRLWGNSYSNKEIAEKLFISIRTVESHKNHIMQKLNLKTAVDLVKFAIRNNIISIS
jgi:two-component system response regulator NreC